MPLFLFAAASFACLNPTHSDGDNIRCANIDGAMRLHGIDAPEMPGSCRPGRACTPGDPYAARDQLRSLTRGRDVQCEQVDTDDYGRRVVECRADNRNIACAMVSTGYAVQRYGAPACGPHVVEFPPESRSEPEYPGGEAPRPGRVDPPAPPPAERPLPPPRVPDEPVQFRQSPLSRQPPFEIPGTIQPLGFAVVWLVIVNLIGFAMMVSDKRRAVDATRRRVRRIPEARLLTVAAIGGSVGVLLAQQFLHHKTLKQPFARNLMLIAGLQLGVIIGILALGV